MPHKPPATLFLPRGSTTISRGDNGLGSEDSSKEERSAKFGREPVGKMRMTLHLQESRTALQVNCQRCSIATAWSTVPPHRLTLPGYSRVTSTLKIHEFAHQCMVAGCLSTNSGSFYCLVGKIIN